ncbi:MAG: class I SAM-dependent methyltransferase [Pseudomonadota bacterium]|nr:class I SAM-dependent methyltransferase [Pseudomonadota bacterium]
MNRSEKYIRSGYKEVHGWLEPFSARYIGELARLQQESGISGASTEIGVHHGKLFILLHLAGSQQKDLAIDVFDDQHLNTDRSGRGDRRRFIDNVIRWGGTPETIDILQKSSLSVSEDEILRRVGRSVLFSIDGGHTEECAFHDLKLADAVLHPEGVVILDDFFNESWPEVCVGAMKYFSDSSARLRPFALTAGKMYLCTSENNAFYRNNLRIRFSAREYDKEASMFGSPVQLMGMTEQQLSKSVKLRRFLRESPLGPTLIKLKNRMRKHEA